MFSFYQHDQNAKPSKPRFQNKKLNMDTSKYNFRKPDILIPMRTKTWDILKIKIEKVKNGDKIQKDANSDLIKKLLEYEIQRKKKLLPRLSRTKQIIFKPVEIRTNGHEKSLNMAEENRFSASMDNFVLPVIITGLYISIHAFLYWLFQLSLTMNCWRSSSNVYVNLKTKHLTNDGTFPWCFIFFVIYEHNIEISKNILNKNLELSELVIKYRNPQEYLRKLDIFISIYIILRHTYYIWKIFSLKNNYNLWNKY